MKMHDGQHSGLCPAARRAWRAPRGTGALARVLTLQCLRHHWSSWKGSKIRPVTCHLQTHLEQYSRSEGKNRQNLTVMDIPPSGKPFQKDTLHKQMKTALKQNPEALKERQTGRHRGLHSKDHLGRIDDGKLLTLEGSLFL